MLKPLFYPMATGSIANIADGAFLRRLNRAARRLFPRTTIKSAGERVLFVVRYCEHLPQSRRWLDFIERGAMAEITALNPHLYKKIIRPYVCKSWTTARKLKALTDNYQFWMEAVPPEIVRGVFTTRGITLHELATKNDRLTLRLRYDTRFNKEGEATLELISTKHDCRISALAFTVSTSIRGAPTMLIGCIQGLPAEMDKNIIKEVTKEMHGLRPKALLLQLSQELAAALGITAILGISNRAHISQHWNYALNRTRRPNLGYDEFWQEMGGLAGPDGFFKLPLMLQPRTHEEIKPNKRALYKQRYELIEQLQGAIRSRLKSFGFPSKNTLQN